MEEAAGGGGEPRGSPHPDGRPAPTFTSPQRVQRTGNCRERRMPISLVAKTLGADAESSLIPLYPLPRPNPSACLLGSAPKICSQTHLVCAIYTATIVSPRGPLPPARPLCTAAKVALRCLHQTTRSFPASKPQWHLSAGGTLSPH